jgi:hypothetical protein
MAIVKTTQKQNKKKQNKYVCAPFIPLWGFFSLAQFEKVFCTCVLWLLPFPGFQ